jgi:ADP-heptose:LPS heptosyltransferase
LTPSNILLLRFRRIGDIVMTTPAVVLLKEHFPSAALTYLVEEPYRRLVDGNSALDRIIAVPAKQSRSDLARLIRDIRTDRYDALLDFHGGPRASWITLLGGARLKIGYAIPGKRFLYDIRIPRRGPNGPVHSVVNHANLVRALGAMFGPGDIPPLDLPDPRPEEKARITGLLHEADVEPAYGEKLVALHIGAGNKFRDWGSGSIVKLITLYAGLPRVRVGLLGAETDKPAEEAILREAPGRAFSLVGRLNLIEIREVVRRAALFVGPDSGPMHIAASTPTPIVAYFGPTLPAHFGPWRPGGEPTVILEKSLPCRPCPQRRCETGDYRCLLEITPEEVFAASRPFLV